MLEIIGVAIGIFLLRVLGNTITTLRLVMLARNRMRMTFVLSFIESLIFAVALGAVVTNLDSILNLVAYAGGFAVGGPVGMWLESKLTFGYVSLTVISPNYGHAVAEAIRQAGFGATEVAGQGAEGDVVVIETVLERNDLSACLDAIQKADSNAFVTTQALQSTRHGYVQAVRPGLARLPHIPHIPRPHLPHRRRKNP